MFARIRIPGSAPYTALLVPDVAIGTEQVRKFVYVVAPTAPWRRNLSTPGQLVGELRVIKEGLSPDRPGHRQRLMRARARARRSRRSEEGAASATGRPRSGIPSPAKAD